MGCRADLATYGWGEGGGGGGGWSDVEISGFGDR